DRSRPKAPGADGRQAVPGDGWLVQEPVGGQGRDRSDDWRDPEGERTGHLGPRIQGRASRLHVDGTPGRLQGRELYADADERDLLEGEEGRASQVGRAPV